MLKEKINKDFMTAFKARSASKTLLGTLKSEIQAQEKNEQVDNLSDEEVTKILLKFAKGVKQNLTLVDDESTRNELVIIESYLPKQMSREEIQAKIDEIVAGGASNIGQVMGQFAKLDADKKLVSELARKSLA